MSDLFGNHIVGFPTRRLTSLHGKTYDPKIVVGNCDLISVFSDFALYLDTQLVYFHISFRL